MGFKRFDPEDLVISTDSITATVWSNNTPTLTSFFTSTSQTLSNTGQYYYHVYNLASSDPSAAIQFDIAYCDINGSGSEFFNSLVTGSSPTRTNYGQYRTLVLGDENADFIFGNETGSYFYALSMERARYKEKLLPGTMTLNLSGSTGANLSLTDDSSIQSSVTFTDAGRVYNIVSGSAGTVYTGAGVTSEGWSPGSGSYGLFLPDIGTILLNGKALDGLGADGGIELGTGRNQDTQDNNPAKLFTAMEGAGSAGNGFLLNSEETLSSDFIFVRARNSEFNYSENPSYISGST